MLDPNSATIVTERVSKTEVPLFPVEISYSSMVKQINFIDVKN